MLNLEEVDIEDIFTLSVEDRKKLIEMGAIALLQEIAIFQVITDNNFQKALNMVMDTMERHIKEATKEDNYELSYYLEEVKWQTINHLNGKKDVFL